MLDMSFDFNTYRKQFNRMFKVTVDGKYKGLSTLFSVLGSLQFQHFVYKFHKLVSGRHGRYYIPPVDSDVFTLKIAGHRLRVYAY